MDRLSPAPWALDKGSAGGPVVTRGCVVFVSSAASLSSGLRHHARSNSSRKAGSESSSSSLPRPLPPSMGPPAPDDSPASIDPGTALLAVAPLLLNPLLLRGTGPWSHLPPRELPRSARGGGQESPRALSASIDLEGGAIPPLVTPAPGCRSGHGRDGARGPQPWTAAVRISPPSEAPARRSLPRRALSRAAPACYGVRGATPICHAPGRPRPLGPAPAGCVRVGCPSDGVPHRGGGWGARRVRARRGLPPRGTFFFIGNSSYRPLVPRWGLSAAPHSTAWGTGTRQHKGSAKKLTALGRQGAFRRTSW